MLDAGSITTTLRGRFDPAAFAQFDAANKRAVAAATEAEAAQSRGAKAHERAATSAVKAAAANDAVAASNRRLSGSIPLRAMDQWDKSSKQAEKNLNSLGRGAAIGAGVGLASLAAATIYAAKTAGDFEKQMRNVNSIAKLSEAGYKSLSKGVLSLAGETAQAPKVLAEGLYQLVSSGFNASDSLKILKASAFAATAGLTDTATATTAVAAVLNAYREPAANAGKVSDVLFETVNRGVLTFDELSKHIGEVLPYAAALGVSLPQVGAAISTMTKEGINAPETMTRLRRVIQSFIKPSKDMSAAIKETGASSGEALVKQKGLEGALAAIVKTTDGSKASLAKLFPDIRALGGVLALTGKNAKSAAEDLKAFQDTGGATKKVFEEQAKGAEFAGKRLSSSFQTAAIIVGNQVLPILADAAGKLTHILQGAASDGSLERLGQGIVHTFETLGQAAGQVGGPLLEVAGALVSVGQALGLGNASELAGLAAAFLAFKGVTFVAPILTAIGSAIATIGLAAATAPSIGAFVTDLVAMAGPVGLIAGGLALAAGAFVAFGGSFGASTSAAEKNAAAMRADKTAIEDLHNATTKASEAHIAAERAALAHKKAVERLKQVEKEVGEGKLKGPAASDAKLEARLGVAESANQHTAAIKTETAALEKRDSVAVKGLATARAQQDAAAKELDQMRAAIPLSKSEEARNRKKKELVALQENYNRAAQKTAQITAEIAVKQESLNRVNAGQSAISTANAQGVQQLQQALASAHAPQKIVTRYELDDQGAQAKLGALSQQLSQLGKQSVVAKVLTTAPNAASAVEALKAVLHGVPASKVIRILHNAPSAGAAILALRAIIAGVPASKAIHILTTAPSAQSAVEQLRNAINSLSNRTVTITTISKTINEIGTRVLKGLGGKASGRRPGPTEAALVGEGSGPEYVIDRSGQGYIVSEPTVTGLAPDDYVIPLEDRYRGRAWGLFAQLASDLAIPGYKAGKKGKGGGGKHGDPHPGKNWQVPNAVPPLSLPLDDIKTKQSAAKSAEDKAKSKVKGEDSKIASLEKQIRTGERAKKPNRAKLSELRAELAKVKRSHTHDAQQLAKDKRETQEWTRTLHEAEAFQAKIKQRELEANNAGQAMKLAAGHDDRGAYDAAKAKRLGALGALQQLIKEAQKQVKTGTEYALQLEGQVQGYEEETQGTGGEAFAPTRDKAAEDEERTGMTAAEVAEEKRIERDIALASLTPDLGDDKGRAGELVGFLQRVLGEVQAEPGPRGGDESIASIANALHTAQGNLASLTTGAGTNENADLQAQINQAKEQRDVEKRRADISEQAFGVLSGSGDIGSGGRNAAAAGSNINIYTLHPGDPATLTAIGNAATAGIGLQGSRRAVRTQVGP
ncbi:MAG: hypothetical protein QOI89_2486 [Solirubrobacteraceae bacterium]|jgi:TP901 family phage tail tape measure protein|nr:hypothetical protein [Solirubrobacteraceae bacterium]